MAKKEESSPPSWEVYLNRRADMLSSLEKILREELRRGFRKLIPSETLKRSTRIIRTGQKTFRGELAFEVRIPQYWAPYYLLGRGVVRPKDKRWLVWYRDPSQDPRLNPPPIRLEDVRSLSREQYYEDLRAGKIVFRKVDGIFGMRIAGPWKGVPGFERGVDYIFQELGEKALFDAYEKFILRIFGKKRTVRISS